MTAHPTIDPDAIGITDSASQRTGSVVEQLLAPPAAGDSALVEIPTERIHNHPRNRKVLADDVADIVAGLKAGEPILNPIGVTAAADWNAGKPDDLPEIPPGDYMITAGGHRRLAAAELAGLTTVPCIVRATFAGGAGRRAALLENVQRKDLDEFEQAEAIAELVGEPYKMSQRDIAKMLDCNQSHVSKRLKLLKLPSLVRESVRVGKTTVADAVELARVADQGPIFDAAWERLSRNSWTTGKEAVDTAIAAHEQRIAVDKATAAAAEIGLTLVDRRPTHYPYTVSEPASLEGLKLAPTKHATEPCHAGYISQDGETVLTCTKPGDHLKAGKSTLKLAPRIATQLRGSGGRSNDEAKQRAERRELKKLWPGRAVIAREIVYGRDDLAAGVEAELIARGIAGLAFHGPGRADTWKALCDFIAPLEVGSYPTDEETDKVLAKLPAAVAQRALALAYFESRIRGTWQTWGVDGRFYLDLLAAHGYTITSIEKRKLGNAKPPEADTEVRSCVQCGCTDDKACDGGCAWVAENLCSACSDAIDDGFINEHEQLLEASEAVG